MQTPEQIIDEGYRELERRLARLRLTETEMVALSTISYSTYWRCKPRSGDGHAPANLNSRTKTLKALERALDDYAIQQSKQSEAAA